MEEGADCSVWWVDGAPAHWRWETDREVYLSYLGARVGPREGDLLTAEVFTHPGFRNRGFYTRASLYGLQRARARGYLRVIGLVGTWNRPVYQVMTSKTGYSFTGRVGLWRVGSWRRHFTHGEVPFDLTPARE
jgi:hypothetical protein